MSSINDTDIVSSILLTNATATDGRCDQGCNMLGLFLALIAVAIFFIFMLQVPYVIITVRLATFRVFSKTSDRGPFEVGTVYNRSLNKEHYYSFNAFTTS